MTYHNIINKWKTLQSLTPSLRKQKLIQWISKKGFTTNESLEGTYKNVYIHPNYNFVIKLSKKGIGNSLPRNKKATPFILQPLYFDKYLLLQLKVDCSEGACTSAYLSLRQKIKEHKLTQFFASRDFSENNCGMLGTKPYIFDISYFSGYETK